MSGDIDVAPHPPPILAVSDVSKRFAVRRNSIKAVRRATASVVALDGVSLELREGEVVGVVGESGSGKTTLAKVIVRLLAPDTGAVRFRDRDIFDLRARDATDVARRIQMIYQDPYSSLNPRLTVGFAVGEAARAHGFATHKTVHQTVRGLLEQVHLSSAVAACYPHELSGGQRQRVAIARALAVRPDVLICDEAVSALDVSIQAQVLNLILELHMKLGLAILFISHQLAVVSQVADRVAVMYLGRIVESGPVGQVFSRPAHPYTQALLAAQPGAHRRCNTRAEAIAGEIPSPMDIPSGCRFRNRCWRAEARCGTTDPPEIAVEGAHSAWCHSPTGVESTEPEAIQA